MIGNRPPSRADYAHNFPVASSIMRLFARRIGFMIMRPVVCCLGVGMAQVHNNMYGRLSNDDGIASSFRSMPKMN